MAVQKNFTLDQNTTFTFEVIYKDNAQTPINLTGCSAKMQVRDTAGGSQLAFTLSSPSAGITIDGSAGKITVKMTPAQTNKLFYPKSSYDLMLTDTNSNRTKLVEGFITLSRSVTLE
jgi:hypothetical protein